MPSKLEGKYGRLSTLKPTNNRSSSGGIYWSFRCDCGKITEHVGSRVLSGNIKSCGCSRRSDDVIASAIKIKYSDYHYSASVRKIEFRLTKEEFASIVCKPCVYCGGFDEITRKTFTAQLTGVDRVDSDVGYEVGNC